VPGHFYGGVYFDFVGDIAVNASTYVDHIVNKYKKTLAISMPAF
jgi:hypothetical protein